MNENEKHPEQEQLNDVPMPEENFDLDELLREFAPEENGEGERTEFSEDPGAFPEILLSFDAELPAKQQETAAEETIRIDLPTHQKKTVDMGDTIRLENVEQLAKEAREEAASQEKPAAPEQNDGEQTREEAFSGAWQPEFEQPMGEYVPPQPIIFHPRSRLRELKRKLVAGPEKRYYEISEIGFGKLQIAIFLSLLVVVLSAGATAMYAMGMVSESRIKLMVFFQFFTMLVSALLGCYQMMEGISELFKGRFTYNTMLLVTFAACCADGVLCLKEQRIPCCAAFSLQVMMCLWGAYHRRSTEMAMMDTMRKGIQMDGIKAVPDFYDGTKGLVRAEGEVEDFMDNYAKASRPEKVMNWYALAATVVSIGNGVAAWLLQDSLSFGLQVISVSLLAAVPVTSFITLTRPMAVLERKLHKLGTVLCGWQGVVGLSGRAAFPMKHEDLFPVGSCKLNGVKFYGTREPDQVVAYCAALVTADGGGLVPLFEHLLNSRNGRHYRVDSFRSYNGGIGGEVCGEPVLLGTLNCLKELGVEIPEGTSVNHAVYAAIDGEFSGVFAVTYSKLRSSTIGLRTLCAYRKLRPVMTSGDFMMTDSFIRSRFGVNSRRIIFPNREVREELSQVCPESDNPALAIVTGKGFAPFAFAVTGARSLRTASWIGVVVHMLGGILGLGMMTVLAVLGAADLLTPTNLLLYELIWLVPGLLITEWTRSV